MSATPRLVLPFIVPGQAQKELFHNEALQLLDLIVSAAVEGLPLAAPPGSPAVGSCYIVGAGATGAWAGQADKLAAFTSGGWRFVAPFDGLSALVRSSGSSAVYRNGAWEVGTVRGSEVQVDGIKVVGARQAAIPAPAGGSVVDSEARAAIGAILAAVARSYPKLIKSFAAGRLDWSRRSIEAFRQQLSKERPCAETGALIMCSRSSTQERTLKGDNYAQAGHWHGARIDDVGHAGRRSRRLGLCWDRGRRDARRGSEPRL